jgi:putative transposase
MLDISRQAVWKFDKAKKVKHLKLTALHGLVRAIRWDHPRIGCRKLHTMLKPEGIGRDKFENWALTSGYRVSYPRNLKRTTYSQKVLHYPNRIKGLELQSINHVWQTDITYIYVNGRFYYLTFIIDIYSQRIVGYKASKNLFAKANIDCLKMALRLRGISKYSKLIHHSDKGSQYIATKYLDLLKHHNIQISMCDMAWENAYAERINGVIKNEYLIPKKLKSFSHLKGELRKAVKLYNQERPHGTLKSTPIEFEKYIITSDTPNKPTVKLYTEANSNLEGASSPNQIYPELPPVHITRSIRNTEKKVNLI